jgi:hypothetical protein
VIEFEAWPSTPRLFRDMVITEKIDGTNAAIVIDESGGFACQSRKRLVTPDDDNFGFAAWAHERREELTAVLGPGRHFGEWWGKGIQRGYGLTERRFSLFNVQRWGLAADGPLYSTWPAGLSVVPMLHTGPFSLLGVEVVKNRLRISGSQAAPGFKDPEGVIVWHTAARQKFKSTYEDCDDFGGGGKTWQRAS